MSPVTQWAAGMKANRFTRGDYHSSYKATGQVYNTGGQKPNQRYHECKTKAKQVSFLNEDGCNKTNEINETREIEDDKGTSGRNTTFTQHNADAKSREQNRLLHTGMPGLTIQTFGAHKLEPLQCSAHNARASHHGTVIN